MLKIEEYLTEIGGLKKIVSYMRNTVTDMTQEMTNGRSQINDYENSIQNFSVIYDDQTPIQLQVIL